MQKNILDRINMIPQDWGKGQAAISRQGAKTQGGTAREFYLELRKSGKGREEGQGDLMSKGQSLCVFVPL